MSVHFDWDDLLSFPEAARLSGGIHISTLHRWRLRGVRGVKLACIKIGGKRFVTRRALEAFVAHSTAASDGAVRMPAPPSRKLRERQIADAEARCKKAGI